MTAASMSLALVDRRPASHRMARKGVPSLTSTSHTPVTTMERAMAAEANPNERYIDQIRPMEMALPPGMRLVTVVVDQSAHSARRRRSPGSAAIWDSDGEIRLAVMTRAKPAAAAGSRSVSDGRSRSSTSR